MGEWIVDIISFQKIFGLCGLNCHRVEIWRDVTLVHGQRTDNARTECEDRARILETEFAIKLITFLPKVEILHFRQTQCSIA